MIIEPYLLALEKNGILFNQRDYFENVLTPRIRTQAILALKIAETLDFDTADLDDPRALFQSLYNHGYRPYGLQIEYLEKQPELIYQLLTQYKKSKQFLNTFGEPLLNRLDRNQRLHGHWDLSPKTGRLVCKGVPLQAFPKEVSSYFSAPKGKVLVTGDYTLIELAILAHLSKDASLMDAFFKGIDLHRLTAHKVFHVDIDCVSEEERQLAKKLNFSLIYGISTQSLKCTLSHKGFKYTSQEVASIRSSFFKAYPGVSKWQCDVLGSNWIRAPDGKIWTGLTRTQRLSYPIQSLGAVIIKLALETLLIEAPSTFRLVLSVHDSISIEVAEEDLDLAMVFLKKIMLRCFKTVINDVPVDVVISINSI